MIQIKGISSITPLGLGVEELSARSLLNDKANLLAPPEFYNYKYLSGLNLLPKISQYGCISVYEAIRFAGYAVNSEKDSKTAVIVSNNYGSIHAIKDMFIDADKYGPKGVNPRFFPGTVLNVVAGHISIKFRFSGPNITISEGVESGCKSLLYAYELLNREDLKRVLVCDLNIFPPTGYKKPVENYLTEFEHVSTILMEKVDEGVDRKEGVSIAINNISESKNEYFNNKIMASEFTPKLLTNVYKILKYEYNSQTEIQVSTDDSLFNIILN
ncbi:beta-ketoacyl synthase N-terminal-like domain-containing protein [Oceanobacillus profundus]|uniref:beta-ketoacyl synthase N-terminal-like domain-containing protein n=1 Tax=Oceanobacillus TaxID=182709 RepID=UPI000BA73D94|nr:beta-ketoacyl synthase N-terminal-like domain-containing protein [Oceanobacillus profundus]MCM3399718.1 hypothetical protein [Oceanobacillus profundus]PAE28244.1 hypothetical protein CHI07_15795 [Paenibacillus sp. 7884-2]